MHNPEITIPYEKDTIIPCLLGHITSHTLLLHPVNAATSAFACKWNQSRSVIQKQSKWKKTHMLDRPPLSSSPAYECVTINRYYSIHRMHVLINAASIPQSSSLSTQTSQDKADGPLPRFPRRESLIDIKEPYKRFHPCMTDSLEPLPAIHHSCFQCHLSGHKCPNTRLHKHHKEVYETKKHGCKERRLKPIVLRNTVHSDGRMDSTKWMIGESLCDAMV